MKEMKDKEKKKRRKREEKEKKEKKEKDKSRDYCVQDEKRSKQDFDDDSQCFLVNR